MTSRQTISTFLLVCLCHLSIAAAAEEDPRSEALRVGLQAAVAIRTYDL